MFKKIGEFFSKVFKSGIDFLKPKAECAVKVVNVIKDVIESPFADVLVNLTKTDIDNGLLKKLRIILPKVVFTLLTVDVIVNAGSTDEEIIQALVEYLRKQNNTLRAAYYTALAAKIHESLEDGKISFGEAVSITQIVYQSINVR